MEDRARRESLGKKTRKFQHKHPNGRHHLVLVPGFGGFDALGSLRYYHGVTDVLRAHRLASEFTLHYFPNLPTSSVQTRARQLQRWLTELWNRQAIFKGDHIHLIGHSTGGLDIRQLLSNYRQQVHQHELGLEGSWAPVLDCIASVQFLSTPHRGTALAHHLSRTWLRRVTCQLLLFGGYQGLRGLGERGSGQVGRLGKLLAPSTCAPDWVDALIDTLRGPYLAHSSLECAFARSAYFTLLRWLLDMASDFSAITDLDSYKPPPGSPASPAHQDKADYEADKRFLKEERKLHMRSYVTVAPAPTLKRHPFGLFTLSYLLTAYKPPARFRSCTVRELQGKRQRTLQPSENDGFVNSVSQVWPDEQSSRLVEGDHADVIGHFRAPPAVRDVDVFAERQYDLLGSQADFNEETFKLLWCEVGRFAMEGEEAQPRREPWRRQPSAGEAHPLLQ